MRNHFEQAHVAWGIEEVGAKEALLVLFGQLVGDFAQADAGGVGRHWHVRLGVLGDPLMDAAFDIEALDDRLDDPVAFG